MVTMWIKSGALTEPLCSYTASPHVSVMRKTGVGRCFGHHQAQSLWYFLFKPQKKYPNQLHFQVLKARWAYGKKKKIIIQIIHGWKTRGKKQLFQLLTTEWVFLCNSIEERMTRRIKNVFTYNLFPLTCTTYTNTRTMIVNVPRHLSSNSVIFQQ